MSKPTPKSNILQTLLIFAVVFLAMQLFFGRNQNNQQPVGNPKETFDKALKSKDTQEIIKAASTYSATLREKKKIPEARAVEMQAADALTNAANEKKDFNEALTAYNEYHKVFTENPNDDFGKAAATAMPKIAEQANDIAKSNTGPTRYGYAIIDGLVNAFHSYWLAAVLLAIIVRAMVWPLASKQMMGFKRMALLQPMMKELQQKYQGPELNQRMMALYRKYGINPLAGCWPLLIQMPFFLWVFYSMRQYQFEFHKGTFLWINPGSATQNPGIFGANLGERDAPLVILYGISMVVSTLVSVNDPNSAKQARITGILMAVLFTGIMLFTAFPSAFVLYWTVLNILATAQSIFISRQPVPPLVERPDVGGQGSLFAGMMPKDGPTGNGGNGSSLGQTKTGAPVVHKPKGGKGKKR